MFGFYKVYKLRTSSVFVKGLSLYLERYNRTYYRLNSNLFKTDARHSRTFQDSWVPEPVVIKEREAG